MRPGQNKRMRGRNNNNNRKGPNPLTRSYESNGPDVKIRGTAHHIGEKYLQLARDAQSSGDPVMAESYLQHAEHYFRLIAAAQQAQQQAQFGYQRPPGEGAEASDDSDDDDFESLPDRFASPSDRGSQPAQNQQPPYEQRPPSPNGAQPYENRPDRPQPQQSNYPDRQHGGDRQERSYDNRDNRGDRNYQDRPFRDRNNQDRGNYEGRGGQDRQRDFDNRGYRGNRGPRDFRENGQPREARPVAEEQTNGLPAFITGAGRPVADNESQPQEPDVNATTETGDDGFHMRPRRRRRPRPEFGGSEGETRSEAPASDPVGD